jgi:hypothetical protein
MLQLFYQKITIKEEEEEESSAWLTLDCLEIRFVSFVCVCVCVCVRARGGGGGCDNF